MTRRARAAGALAILLGMSVSAHAQMVSAASNAAAPFGPPVDDQRIYVHGTFDQLEGRLDSGNNAARWEGEGWAGTDTNRLWLRSEADIGAGGKVADGQQEALYDRPVSSYFDLQVGGRYDLDSKPGRGWGAFGIEGLTPYFLRVSATGYVSDAGHYAAKLEGSYDQLITQRLILQPEAEVNLYAKDDPARDIGSGFSDIDAGLRLRYEITRKFAPYIAATYAESFGRTASFARTDGERQGGLRVAFGLRSWF